MQGSLVTAVMFDRMPVLHARIFLLVALPAILHAPHFERQLQIISPTTGLILQSGHWLAGWNGSLAAMRRLQAWHA